MTIYASNAERPIAGNAYVPDSMEARGIITPKTRVAEEIRNGDGLLVAVGLESFVWLFEAMTKLEFSWWLNLVGSGAGFVYSQKYSSNELMPAFRLWSTNLTATDYKSGVIDYPTWERYQNAR